MRKVIGIGETVLDIVFRNGVPTGAVPGGSTFNTMVSLGRMGIPAMFLTDVGDDKVGQIMCDFMQENGVDDSLVCVHPEVQSPISLAFLDEQSHADYEFYRYPYPDDPEYELPEVHSEDLVVFGSYYALAPAHRERVTALLARARTAGALIVYDINFRQNHQAEAVKLTGALLENLEYADIVRGSDEDFRILYGTSDTAAVYRKHTAFYCPRLIATCGKEGVDLYAGTLSKHYPALPAEVVSTIGAGDSFNAGIIWGLLQARIRQQDLDTLSENDWDAIIRCGNAFSADTCASEENYVRKGFCIDKIL